MCDELNHNACSLAQEVELKAELEALDRETWQRRWQAEIDIQRKLAADAMKKVNELEVQLLTFEHAKQQAQADLQTEMNRCNSWQEECYKLEQYCQDWGLKHSDLWARHQELLKRLQAAEAVCEALRAALIGCKPLIHAAWKSPDRFYCVAYTEIDGVSPHLLEEDHLDYYMLKKEVDSALNSDAGSALLKRLQAAEAVCEAFYSDYFEAINTVEDEEDFPDWCVAYRKWRELKTGECAIHMEKCDCKAKGE